MTEIHSVSLAVESLGDKTTFQRWLAAVDAPNDAAVSVIKTDNHWYLTLSWRTEQ